MAGRAQIFQRGFVVEGKQKIERTAKIIGKFNGRIKRRRKNALKISVYGISLAADLFGKFGRVYSFILHQLGKPFRECI